MTSSESTEGTFYGLSIVCFSMGAVFVLLAFLVWWFAWRNIQVVLFGVAMLFGGAANGFAFLVLHRMESAGYVVGMWRTALKDFRLYSKYWRIAPQKRWSRLPIIAMFLSFVLAGCFLFSAPALKSAKLL